jgi:carbonic anhydrase
MNVMNTALRSVAFLTLGLLSTCATANEWSYEGESAPEYWGELNPDYFMCSKGMNQSPVDITAVMKTRLMPLKPRYPQSPISLSHEGYTVMANFADGNKNSVKIDGEQFMLRQLHFHAPSENTVGGKHYPLEMHLVHQNAQGETAVVAVMFTTGTPNNELQKLWHEMPREADESVALTQDVDIKKLLPARTMYYRYSGSLTTPPCTEGVRWLVMKEPLSLSAEQLKTLTRVLPHENNRPVQPGHGRVIIE